MATMPTLPETQESIKEEIRRQVCTLLRSAQSLPCTDPEGGGDDHDPLSH